MTAREEYIRALFLLSKSTPPEIWSKFVVALGDYVSDQIERVVSNAPSADIHLAVGYVRYMREFRDEVKNIEVIYQKLDRTK